LSPAQFPWHAVWIALSCVPAWLGSGPDGYRALYYMSFYFMGTGGQSIQALRRLIIWVLSGLRSS
jgi:hypothetical protein